MSDENWGPERELPGNYRVFQNPTGIDFYVPTDSAPANVPYSFEVFAGSINKAELYNGEGVYLHLSGEDAEGNKDVMSGDIDLGGNTIKNSADPVDAQDVATRNYVDTTRANINGDAFQGEVTVISPLPDEVNGSVGARNIWLSTADPVDEGANGDIWVKYIP